MHDCKPHIRIDGYVCDPSNRHRILKGFVAGGSIARLFRGAMVLRLNLLLFRFGFRRRADDLLYGNFALIYGLISVKTGNAGMLVRKSAADADLQTPDLPEIGIGFHLGASQIGNVMGICVV